MSFNINRYSPRKKSLLRYLKVYWKLYLRWVKRTKIITAIKQFGKFILSLLGWSIIFGLILIFSNYNSDYSNIPFWLILGSYISIIFNFCTFNSSYKQWCQNAEFDIFYKKFCKRYQPLIVGDLFIYFIGLLSDNIFVFVGLLFFINIADTWCRRYHTLECKLDILLEEKQKRFYND